MTETAALVVEAQSGNAAAMDLLLRAWRPRLVRCATGLVSNEAAAQDIVQETLLKVAGNLEHLANPAAFASWVFTILRRIGAEFFRKEGRLQRESVSFDDELLARVSVDRSEACEAGLDLDEGLAQLESEDRDLLRLHYWGGLELREIAPLLGIATGAAKTRLFRARRRLGVLLGRS